MESHHHETSAYFLLIGMGILHIPLMYVLMFSMVDGWSDFRMNLNMLYMAVTMAAPMVVLMPVMMPPCTSRRNGTGSCMHRP